MCRCAEPTSPHAIDRPNAVRCRIQRIERKIQVVQRSEHLSGPLIDRGRDQALATLTADSSVILQDSLA